MSVINAKDLLSHQGHKVVVVTYGDIQSVVNVAIECEDCYTVLKDYDREDEEMSKEFDELLKHEGHKVKIVGDENEASVRCLDCQRNIFNEKG